MTQPLAAFLAQPPTDDRLVVVALCASWCGTCREFAATFADLAATHADMAFVWADVEDDADLLGDLDVENFPTLALYRAGTPLHFGVSLPHPPVVARLIEAVAKHGAPGTADFTVVVRELGERLAGR